MKSMKTKPFIGNMGSGVGNWLDQFWRNVPVAWLMLLALMFLGAGVKAQRN
jgi:hypothetical protein